jgi:hypothetical protein
MTAYYRILETRRFADDLVLGYRNVDFSFTDRPPLQVYLSVLVKQSTEGDLISHYQVSISAKPEPVFAETTRPPGQQRVPPQVHAAGAAPAASSRSGRDRPGTPSL